MADHACEKCKPYQDEFDRLTEPGPFGTEETWQEVEDARFALEVFQAYVCAEAPPELHETFLPGGESREEFLENRVISKCKPCQPLADELTTRSMSARAYRAYAQQQQLDAADGKYIDPEQSVGAESVRQTRYVRVLEKLLAACEKVHCPPTDLERASQALLKEMEGYTPPVTPRPDSDEKEAGNGGSGVISPVRMVILVTIILAVIGAGWALTRGSSDEAAPSVATTNSTTSTDSVAESPVVTAGFAESKAGFAIVDAALGFGAEPDEALSCISNGMALRNTTDAEFEALNDSDISTWPAGLADRYAEVLEECIPLRPFYLDWFGRFEFTDSACVVVMTNHVLANYSWRRFLEEGILDADLRVQLQARFNTFVDAGYVEKGCFSG